MITLNNMTPINTNSDIKYLNVLPVFDMKEHFGYSCNCHPKIVEKDDKIFIIHQDYDLKNNLFLRFHNLILYAGQLN